MRNPWGTAHGCLRVFPHLDMQDEVDQVELGDRVWCYL